MGPSTRTLPSATLHLDAGGDGNRLFADTGHAASRLAFYGWLSTTRVQSNFAAQTFGAGLAVAHDAAARAQDADAQAVEHRLELLVAAVEPAGRAC